MPRGEFSILPKREKPVPATVAGGDVELLTSLQEIFGKREEPKPPSTVAAKL